MDDLNLDDLEKDINNKNAVEERVRNTIAAKKEAEAKAEEAQKKASEALEKVAQMEKETKFLNSFADSATKFPGIGEYKDKIKEKVLSGYTFDDAAVSILVSEGKYTPPEKPKDIVAGGSASNQITNNAQKSVTEMSKDEKWAALKEEERKGNIGLQ